MIHVLGISGGKDSTALWLWALREGLPNIVPLFNDTHWEAPQTLAYLEGLERRLGPLRRTQSEGFEARARRTNGFPSSHRKWCTDELKIKPTARFLDELRESTGDEVTMVVGVRREESRKRAAMAECEWSDAYDCEVWRPLLDWTLADVISEHHRAGVPLNPLYLAGAERVGCWPCIHAGKTEIELVARIDPRRIDRIREIEAATGRTMFAQEAPVAQRVPGEPRHALPLPIDEAVAWSRTDRGGVRLRLFPEPSGCARWGICEQGGAP